MENSWPALSGWTGQPDTLSTRRAIYGKVHRAPTDYRWIGWSDGFGSAPPTRDQELSINTRGLPAVSIGWRYSQTTGPFAIRFYASRAFDAAGRPGGVEKQILTPLAETYTGVPPVALAFLLLDAASPFDDTIWWDSWRDPAWTSMTHYRAIEDIDCPLLDVSRLDKMIEDGLSELLAGVDESSLISFYSQILAGTPAVLKTSQEIPLSPLAMAALLLPLDRSQTEELSIAGGVFPAIDGQAQAAKWNEIVCIKDGAISPSAVPTDAVRVVDLLKLGHQNGGQLPVPPSPGGSFLEGFLNSEGRWLAPGKMGTEALGQVGPWPTVKRPREVARLRILVEEFRSNLLERPSSESPDEVEHKWTKYELLLSLLVVICPGQATCKLFRDFGNPRVPALYFISRIEPDDWNDIAQRYTREEFLYLAAHSLNLHEVAPLRDAVRSFLLAQVSENPSSLMAKYASDALNASARP